MINTLDVMGFDPCTDTGQWKRISVDLSSYAGQDIDLKFHSYNAGFIASPNPNSWLIDDVTFEAAESLNMGLQCWQLDLNGHNSIYLPIVQSK